jgi:hypothetical protein
MKGVCKAAYVVLGELFKKLIPRPRGRAQESVFLSCTPGDYKARASRCYNQTTRV